MMHKLSFHFGSHIEVIMPATNIVGGRGNQLKKKLYYLHMTLTVLFYKFTSDVAIIEVSHADS